MRLLPFRIGEGDLGPRLAQPKAQLPEQALALTHAQRDAVLLSDPDRQRFAIPQIAAQPGLPRRLAKSRADLFQLLLIQAPRPGHSLLQDRLVPQGYVGFLVTFHPFPVGDPLVKVFLHAVFELIVVDGLGNLLTAGSRLGHPHLHG